MTAPYTVYDPSTGAVRWRGFCPEADLDLQGQGPGEALIKGPHKAHQYVDLDGPEPELKDQLDMPATLDTAAIAADGVDKATITGIPAGTEAVVQAVGSSTVNDGEVSVTSDIEGDIVIALAHLKYKRTTYVVSAS